MAKKIPWTIFPKLKESHSSLVGIQYVVVSRWYGGKLRAKHIQKKLPIVLEVTVYKHP